MNKNRCKYCNKFIGKVGCNCNIKEIYLTSKKIIELYNNNLSLRKIAHKFGCSKEIIRKILIKSNISLRDKTFGTSYERKYFIKEDMFKKIDNKEKAYWLGFIYADGNVYKQRLRIVLNKKDKFHLYKFKKFIGYTGKVKEFEDYCEINIWNNELINDLTNLGVVPRKSKIITFPKIDKLLINSFILGYFDGDGWVSVLTNKRNIQLGFCSGSNDFIVGLRDYFSNKGFSKRTILKQKKSNTYSILFNGYEGFKIINFLKNLNLQLNRKLGNVALPSVVRLKGVVPYDV